MRHATNPTARAVLLATALLIVPGGATVCPGSEAAVAAAVTAPGRSSLRCSRLRNRWSFSTW